MLLPQPSRTETDTATSVVFPNLRNRLFVLPLVIFVIKCYVSASKNMYFFFLKQKTSTHLYIT